MADGSTSKTDNNSELSLLSFKTSNVNPETMIPRNEIGSELAASYSEYITVDIKDEKRLVEETTDELLTKLEELINLVDSVRSDNSTSLSTNLPKVRLKCEELEKVFQNIDRLEAFVDMVRENVEILDSKVVEAERFLLPENSLSKLFKPLFSRKDSPKPPSGVVPFEASKIFETFKYIHPKDIGSNETS